MATSQLVSAVQVVPVNPDLNTQAHEYSRIAMLGELISQATFLNMTQNHDIHHCMMAASITRSSSNGEPLGYGGSEDLHHAPNLHQLSPYSPDAMITIKTKISERMSEMMLNLYHTTHELTKGD